MLASRRAEAEALGVPPQLIEDILRRTMRESYLSEKDSGFKCLNPDLRNIVVIGGKGKLGQLFCRMFKLSGYHVKSYNTDIPSIDINDNLLLKMKKIVKEYNLRYENWGWKDPRTCLTVEYWVNIMQELDLSDDIKIIFVVRKALSVSRSLKKRNELPLEQGLELWKAYTERALKFCNGFQLPTHYCSFEALLKDPLSTCDSLFGFLNEQWDPKVVDQFVDSSCSNCNIVF